ncbi:MAG: glycosyltransferase [Gemmatimonadales bacterium]
MPEVVDRERLPTVVAFANDWGTDPTSKHHLMRLLAERTSVLWVEASGMRRPTTTSGADWSRIGKKLRRVMGGIRTGAPGLSVLSPPALPLPSSPLARALNARLYQRSVRRALTALRHDARPLLWIYTPTVARYLDRLPARGLVYHCVDRWWAFKEYDTDEMRCCHEILCRRADHVFVSSRELEQDALEWTNRVSYLPHGVEWESFHRAVTEPLQRPADLPERARPIVGFVGMLDEWIDQDLVRQVALAHPQADVVMIGAARVPIDTLAGIPNLHLLGRRPFRELPAYLAQCQVALIPFELSELTRAVNPIKLREYLSAGVPVVTTALPELIPFRGHAGVDVVSDRLAFVAAVGARLATPLDLADRRRLSESMRGEGWAGRLDEMLRQVDRLL